MRRRHLENRRAFTQFSWVSILLVVTFFVSFGDPGSAFLTVSGPDLRLKRHFVTTSLRMLSAEEVGTRLRVVVYGQGFESRRALECVDRAFYDELQTVTLSRVGGLGLDLMEVKQGPRDGDGVVIINGFNEGGNAERCGKLCVGDALISVAPSQDEEPNGPNTSLEGLDLDRTISALGRYSEYKTLTLTVRRLVRRKEVVVQMLGPSGEPAGNFTVLAGYGTNLRTALLSQNINLYDESTARFDSPFQTGNCGGDGTCGTCLISVLAGKELLNDRVRVEDKALTKQDYPPNYRWACRVGIAPSPRNGGVVKIKLRPQTSAYL